MLSFEPEIAAARDAGTFAAAEADRRMAIERREIVPVGRELRALAWCGVMLIVTGVGILVNKHFEEIGPLTIAVLIGAAAAACYAGAAWRWKSPPAATSVLDYVVLLGALLISADVAFIETQWHLLDGEWQRHLLLLAVVHAIAAYAFRSRAVLSLSIAAFAGWLGIEKDRIFLTGDVGLAVHAFVCAGALAVWRVVNRRREFDLVFEHFAVNVAFWGAVILAGTDSTRALGVAIALALGAASLLYGIRRQLEAFVIYAAVYSLIAVDIVVLDGLRDVTEAFYLVVSTAACIAALIFVHFRFRRADGQ